MATARERFAQQVEEEVTEDVENPSGLEDIVDTTPVAPSEPTEEEPEERIEDAYPANDTADGEERTEEEKQIDRIIGETDTEALEKRIDEDILKDLMEDTDEIGGIQIRRVGLPDLAILAEARNLFVMGATVDEIKEQYNATMEVCRFLALMHTGLTRKEAWQLVKTDKVDEAAMELDLDATPEQLTLIMRKIFRSLQASQETRMKPSNDPKDPQGLRRPTGKE